MVLKGINTMDIKQIKAKRSNNFIKLLMVINVLLFIHQYYQTEVFDLGAFASTIAILSLLRGVMLSPFMLTSAINTWFKNDIGFNKESYKYFLLALVLGLIGYL